MDDKTVTGRVVAVLDAVSQLGHRATLAELTRHTGIPKPTVRRIAGDLAERGMLDRLGDTYRLGNRLMQFGQAAGVQHGYLNATVYLQDLHLRSSEIAWLIALTGSNTNTIIDAVFAANRLDSMSRTEWPILTHSAPFLNSAAGRLYLADRPDVVQELRSRPFPRGSGRVAMRWGQVLASLDAARDTGIAVEHEQSLPGWSCVASAIRDEEGSMFAIVGITGRTSTLRTERLARPVLAAADGISRTLATRASR